MNIEWRAWCRLCANNDGSDINLFDKHDLQLTDKIFKYLSISVDCKDDLPKFVCNSCSQRLVTFDRYAEQCLRVQAMFSAMLEEAGRNESKVGLIRQEFLQESDDKDEDEEQIDSKQNIRILDVDADSFIPSENSSMLKDSEQSSPSKQSTKQRNIRTQNRRSSRRSALFSSYQDKSDHECELRCSSRLQEMAEKNVSIKGVEVKLEVQENYIAHYNRVDEDDKGSSDIDEEEKEEDYNNQLVTCKRGRTSRTLVGAAKRKAKVPQVVQHKSDDERDKKEVGAGDASEYVKVICDSDGTRKKKKALDDEKKSDKDSNSQPSIFKWECHVCGEVCRNWYCLSIHCRQLHKVPAQVVCLCAKVLASRTSIIKHRLKHTNAYKYRCDKCDKAFHRKALLDLHILSHVPKEEQPFVCCKCARRFHSEALLRQHERVHLPKEERLIYPCSVCGKKFSSKAAVSYHLKAVHSGERPFVCDQCGHSFTSKGILQEHLTIHSDETPFKCAQCKKSFKTKYRLKIHMDTHRETPYQCPICPLQLSTRRTLRMHLVVHRDTKAYQCATCGKEFRRAKDLKNHHNLHTGRRPYTCTFCPRTFANGSNCRAHKRKMHPEELRLYEAALAAAENEGNETSPVSQASISVSHSTVSKAITGQQQQLSLGSDVLPATTTVSSPLENHQRPPVQSESQETMPVTIQHTEKHPEFSFSNNSPTRKTNPLMYPSSSEHSSPNRKYSSSSSLGINENSSTLDEHMLPHPVSESNLIPVLNMSRINVSASGCGIQASSSSGTESMNDNRHMMSINVTSSRIMPNESVLNAGLTPLNLNMSEMHSSRQLHHHVPELPSEMEDACYLGASRRGVDTFTTSRPQVPMNSHVQVHRQQHHQDLMPSLSRSLGDRDVTAAASLNHVHQHSQHQVANTGDPLQGYTSLNHLYQHHGESMPSAVAAAIAHSSSIGVPAFPGNPYTHHNVCYSRSSSNM